MKKLLAFFPLLFLIGYNGASAQEVMLRDYEGNYVFCVREPISTDIEVIDNAPIEINWFKSTKLDEYFDLQIVDDGLSTEEGQEYIRTLIEESANDDSYSAIDENGLIILIRLVEPSKIESTDQKLPKKIVQVKTAIFGNIIEITCSFDSRSSHFNNQDEIISYIIELIINIRKTT